MYNEDEVIEETIKELKKYGIKQIIVVDGGSKDNTLVKVKNLGVDLIDIVIEADMVMHLFWIKQMY